MKYQSEIIGETILRYCRTYVRSPVLDIGCGNGFLTGLLRRFGFTAVGIDPNPPSRELKGHAQKLPFLDGSMNTIFCIDILEHLTQEELLLALAEAYRVLGVGGIFIINTPNSENLCDSYVECPACGKIFHPIGHKQSINYYQLSQNLSKAGFDIIETKTLSWNFKRIYPVLSWIYYHIPIVRAGMLHKDLFVIARKGQK